MPSQSASWDLYADLQLLLQFHFMQNAFAAGTLVAVLAGATGYFVVLRGQSFAAHMLSQVGFPGAAGAVLLGLPPVSGLLLFCTLAAGTVGWMGRAVSSGTRREGALVGSLLAFSLGLGLLFFRLYAGSAETIFGFLFGTLLGISDSDVLLTLVVTVLALLALFVLGRPLLFSSVDPDVAAARGVPVALAGAAFLVLLALAVAVTVQIVGTLLVFALLVAPGAAALRVTARPVLAVTTSVVISLVVTWLGLAFAYFTDYPVGFFITSLAFLVYVMTRIPMRRRPRARWGRARALGEAAAP